MRCSIIIPTHNRDDLLVRAVTSALRSCPADGEVIVVDDRSIIPATQVLSVIQDSRLRVLSNTGCGGAADARNFGVKNSFGEVIFFLDDDDEIVENYCRRVLDNSKPLRQAGWGFSSIYERRSRVAKDRLRRRKQLRNGVMKPVFGVRSAVVAMSDGFWIKKEVFLSSGGLDCVQRIDEDTDLCIRLIRQSKWPWYETEPGMIVYKDYVPRSHQGAQLTTSTPADKGLECYQRTHDKQTGLPTAPIGMRWFLATRYLRRAIKAGATASALSFAKSQRPWCWALVLIIFVRLKRLSYL